MRKRVWLAVVIGATLVAALVVGGYFAFEHFKRGDDFAIFDDPKRTIWLANDTGHPRVVRRCEWVDDCRSPDAGDLVQPGESFEFRVYLDEERTYVVGGAQVTTLGCVTVHVADGTPNPDSLSDLEPCPG